MDSTSASLLLRLQDTADASTSQIAPLVQPDTAEASWDRDYKQQLIARCMELVQNQFQPALLPVNSRA